MLGLSDLDGIPICGRLTHYLTQHAKILWRHDLDHRLQVSSVTLDPGVVYDTNRHYLSAYVMDITEISIPHGKRGRPPCSFERTSRCCDCSSASANNGPQLDLGCSVGRGTFELAAAHPDTLTLGIDLSFTMLRFARSLTAGEPRYYPRKRVGVVYDSHHIHYPPAARAKTSISGSVTQVHCHSKPRASAAH